MEDWTSGYVADLGYTYGYYPELNPQVARFALTAAGLHSREPATACELGFGQGMSINVHAASSSTQWWGTDFNPAQAGFAMDVSRAAGSEARLFDESFEEFCRRPDLPEMDFIGLHGIWTWISDANRAVIVDFVRRKLKAGGVLYVSYNTLPGWSDAIPLRDLMTGHADVMGAPGQGLVSRIDAAIDFAQRLMQSNPKYAKANPLGAGRLQKIATQNRHYVAHEYFNRDWEPMAFAKMAKWLGPAKLGFACSANLLDHVDALSLTPEQQTLIKEIPDPVFKQTIRDFCVHQQFRKDYWVKGARPMNRFEQIEALHQQRVILCKPAHEVKLKGEGAEGDGKLNEAIYQPILDALSDNEPHTMAQMAQALKGKNIALLQLNQALAVLSAKGSVQPARSDDDVAKASAGTRKLNDHLMNLARGSGDNVTLASPVTGGGVAIPRFHQMFLLARAEGFKTPRDWAQRTWRDLAAQGQALVKDGKSLETVEANVAELTRQAVDFSERRLPILHALQVVAKP